MKPLSLFFLFFWVINLQLLSTDPLNAEDSKSDILLVQENDITFSIGYEKNYTDSLEIPVRQIIENHSVKDIGIEIATEYYGLRIILTGPDGYRIPPFFYSINSKRHSGLRIFPGGREELELSLALCFPFDQVGEYRCSITRLIYDHVKSNTQVETPRDSDKQGRPNQKTAPNNHNFNPQSSGNPIEMTAPEFRFTVQSIKQNPRYLRELKQPKEDMLNAIWAVRRPSADKPNDDHAATENQLKEDEAPRLTQTGTSRNLNPVHYEDPYKSSPAADKSQLGIYKWWWLLAMPVFYLAWLGLRPKKL